MKQRIFSALLIALIGIPLLVIGKLPFAIFITLLSIMSLYELLHMREEQKAFPFLLKMIAYLFVMFFSLLNYEKNVFSYLLDFRVISFVIFVFLLPMIFVKKKEAYEINDALFLIGATLFVGLAFNLAILTRNYDLNYLIYLLLVTTVTDTMALVTGMYIGEHKLCPNISPKKTVEGFIGGVLMGTFVAVGFYNQVINPAKPLVTVIAITLILSIVSQLGDLVFSSIKRTYKKKDFSNLIPGHGGVLDRMDSIIFVLLAFVLLMDIL